LLRNVESCVSQHVAYVYTIQWYTMRLSE